VKLPTELITLVSAVLSIAIGIISLPYAAPYLGVITSFFSICFVVLLFLGWMCLLELILIFSETDRIEYYINTYVTPWQKEFVARVILTNREVLDSNFFKAKDRLGTVIRFLETTNNTKYLRDILVMPSLRPDSIKLLKHWLRKCNLDMLSSKMKILRHLESMMAPGRESEVSAYLASVAGSIVPYRKLCRGLSKIKSFDEGLDETLTFAVEDQKRLEVAEDVVRLYKWELDIWNSRLPAMSEEMTPERLGTEAHRAIRLGSVLFVLSVLTIAALIYFMIRTPILDAKYLIFVGIITAMVIAPMIVLAQSLLLGAKNYPALAGLLEGTTILGLNELRRIAARIVEYGLDYGKLPDVVTLDDKNVTAWDFLYCCGYASLNRQKRFEPMLWFPTTHSVGVRSEEYFFFKKPSPSSSFQTDLVRKGDLTEQEFIDLSSRIANMRGSEVHNVAADEGQVGRLLWLYSNALRIGLHEFDRIEVADIGRLPSYVPVHHESRWGWFGRFKRRILRVFSTGLLE
jgi:hypothetical protein